MTTEAERIPVAATAEAVSLARAWTRAAAFVLQTILEVVVGVGAFFGAEVVLRDGAGVEPQGAATGAVWLAVALLFTVDVLCVWLLRGTVAQRTLGLRVLRASGEGLSLGRAFGRQLMFSFEIFLALGIAGAAGAFGTRAVLVVRGDIDEELVAYALFGLGVVMWLLMYVVGLERDPRTAADRAAASAVVAWGRRAGPPPERPVAAWAPRHLILPAALAQSALVAVMAVSVYGSQLPPPLRLEGLGRHSAAPATMLRLVVGSLSGVEANERIALRFFDERGFDVRAPARVVGADALVAAVPPYLDARTRDFTSATVSVQLMAESSRGLRTSNVVEGFRIDEPPVTKATPGTVTLRLLEVIDVLPASVHERLAALPGAAVRESTRRVREGLDTLVKEAAAFGRLAAEVVARRDDPSYAGLRADFAVLDRLAAAYLVALGPTSPSPCEAKDRYLDTLLNVDRDPDVTADAGRRFWVEVNSCAADQLLEISERTTAWLALLGVAATTAGLGVPWQVIATSAYIPLATATYVIVSATQAVAMGGGEPAARDVLAALSQMITTLAAPLTDAVLGVVDERLPRFRPIAAAALALGTDLTNAIQEHAPSARTTAARQAPAVPPRITPRPTPAGGAPAQAAATPTVAPVALPPGLAPLAFTVEALAPATGGQPYEHSFCVPKPATPTSACGPFPPTSNPSGGQPPYHFQLDSGVGFPPIGVSLSKDGILTGTPATATAGRSYTFSVCAIDLGGRSVCRVVSLEVLQPVVSTPAPTPVALSLAVTSRTCTVRERFPDGSNSWWVDIQGTASGPVQTSFGIGSSAVTFSCGAWGQPNSWSCERTSGASPATVQWSARLPGSPSGPIFRQSYDIFLNEGGQFRRSVTVSVVCP